MSRLKNKSAAEAFRRLVERNFKDGDMELNISYEEESREAEKARNQMSKENIVFYICNGQKEGCRKTDCYINGGGCRHTRDVKFAKNFEQKFPNIPHSKYWEKEDASESETPSEG
ncbi:MAG: hypothetical protein LUE96_07420 [Lachnospiraceae bacterium]|nr:hypothetical protein [Lachnospiraceae bacterium]